MGDKLGRLRLDTIHDIKSQIAKYIDGEKVLMVSKYDGWCAICHERYKKLDWIWYDHTKPKGRRAAHADCYQRKT